MNSTVLSGHGICPTVNRGLPAFAWAAALLLLASLGGCGGGGGTSDSSTSITAATTTSTTVSITATGTTVTTGSTATTTTSSVTANGTSTTVVTSTSSSTVTNPSTSTTVSTNSSSAGILCGVSGSGSQLLTYTNTSPTSASATPVNDLLNYNYSWTCGSTSRTLSGNGVPNHIVTNGEFATRISAQTISASYTLSPALKGSSTTVQIPGYAINSVKFDPATAGTCPSTASASSDCSYAGGSGTWNMVALPGNVSPWKFNFGVDTSLGHVQPNGQYHYHGVPTELLPKLNRSSATSMTLVGWAADGFPIYSNLGYSNPLDTQSALRNITSSYRVKTTPTAGRPSTANFAMGHFEQDWEYAAGLGDLDECNGRTGKTPEYPNGTYHYVMTTTYPYIQRCVKGTAATTPAPAGPPPGP